MDEKDFNKLVEKVGAESAKLISEKWADVSAGLMTKDQLMTELESFAKSSDIEDMNQKLDQVDQTLVEMKKAQENARDERPKSIDEQIAEKHEDIVKAVKEGKKFDLHLKTNVATTSITSDNIGMSVPGYNAPAHKATVMEGLFRRVTMPAGSHLTVYYTDQTTTTRNADTKNEAAAAPESAIVWTRRSLEMQKILDSIPITHEALNHIEQMSEEIQRFLDINMALKIDEQLWSGDNTPPNWYGIYTRATDLSAGIAGAWDKVDSANLADLLAKTATKISNGYKSKYMPDLVLVNPDDVDKIRLAKDANDNYIKVPFMSDDLGTVRNMRVVETNQVTANTCLVGDSRHATYYDVEGVSLEFGLDADDFTKDLITLKARKIGNLLVKTIDAGAFYKVADIDARIASFTA